MALIRVTDVKVLNNPARLTEPFSFEITFECQEQLKHDTDWKMIYVGSADSEQHDQELESVLVGPVNVGRNQFVFEADGPDPTKIPHQELRGVTAVILTCSYREQEFVRIGYYVNVYYEDPEMENEPPEQPQYELLMRNVLASKPRVTRFNINWNDDDDDEVVSHQAAVADDDDDEDGDEDPTSSPLNLA